MNKLIKLLALGTVLPLSLNSLNLISVCYSSDNNLSAGVEDFTWAQEAFKLPKQCFERISYLVNGNIRAKTESISDKNSQDEYWANRAINDKTAAYSESIKNLKIIYTVVREGGEQGLTILRGGILKTIENILNTSSEDEETYKKLMGSLNALLITETVNEMYHGSDKHDSFENLYNSASNNMGNKIINLLGDNTDKYKKLLKIIDKNSGEMEQGECEEDESEQSEQYDDDDLVRKSLSKSMKHDWNCYLRQIGIIEDIVGENDVKKSVLVREDWLTRDEGILLDNKNYCKELGSERLAKIATICSETCNKDKNNYNEFYNKLVNILEKDDNEDLISDAELFDRNPYNSNYVESIEMYRSLSDLKDKYDAKVDICNLLLEHLSKIDISGEISKLKKVLFYEKKEIGGIYRGTLVNVFLSRVCEGLENIEKSLFAGESNNQKSNNQDLKDKIKNWLKQFLDYYEKCYELEQDPESKLIPFSTLDEGYMNKYINRMITTELSANAWGGMVKENISKVVSKQEDDDPTDENTEPSINTMEFVMELVYLKAQIMKIFHDKYGLQTPLRQNENNIFYTFSEIYEIIKNYMPPEYRFEETVDRLIDIYINFSDKKLTKDALCKSLNALLGEYGVLSKLARVNTMIDQDKLQELCDKLNSSALYKQNYRSFVIAKDPDDMFRLMCNDYNNVDQNALCDVLNEYFFPDKTQE